MSEHDQRTVFEEAEAGNGDWTTPAIAYAETPAGRARILDELLPLAELTGDTERADSLQAALLRSELKHAEQELTASAGRKASPAVTTEELQTVANDFGVALEQARRDHAISHVLAALSAPHIAETTTFYGGTALSRTHLPRLRLSEDIDLISRADRRTTAEAIERALDAALARSHGKVTWEPQLSATRGAESAVLRLRDGIVIRVQMMKADDLPPWPTEQRALVQRYSDAKPANLSVFTPAASVAAKTFAWGDRAAARDLYDLWALALLGRIDAAARDAYRRWGQGSDPGAWLFREAPSESGWGTDLAHQGRVRVGPGDALRVVREHWATATTTG